MQVTLPETIVDDGVFSPVGYRNHMEPALSVLGDLRSQPWSTSGSGQGPLPCENRSESECNIDSSLVQRNMMISEIILPLVVQSVSPPDIQKHYKSKPSANTTLSCTVYFKDTVDLRKYRVDELKKLAKYHRLHITGNKPTLIGRIEKYFQQTVCVIRIQRVARGHAVRRAFRLRGPALHRRDMCTNDTDFFQLEPLAEIPHELFFSYTDSDTDSRTFVYGFHLHSLILHWLNKYAQVANHYRAPFDLQMVTNPYNRRAFPLEVVRDIFAAYQYVRTLYPDQRLGNDGSFRDMYCRFMQSCYQEQLPTSTTVATTGPVTWVIRDETTTTARHATDATRQRMEELRRVSLSARIQQLFFEMDHLGNYTNSEWLTSLTRRECMVLYEQLSELWRFRAHIPHNIKMRICPLGDPFYRSMPDARRPSEISTDALVQGCLTVMEHMVFSGVDDEYRKLGALHVLTALTTVSLPARNSMIWLYESIA